MNGKRAVKKSERNYPVKKSLRVKKAREAAIRLREQLRSL